MLGPVACVPVARAVRQWAALKLAREVADNPRMADCTPGVIDARDDDYGARRRLMEEM